MKRNNKTKKLQYSSFLQGTLFILLLLSASCARKKDSSNSLIKIKVNPTKATVLNLSEVVRKIEYIPLETKQGTLLKNIYSLKVVRDTFFIHDGNHVFLFDREGKFISKIGAKGKGPGEFLSLKSFWIDRIHQIIEILDINGKQVVRYHFDGTFINKWDIDFYAYDFFVTNSTYSFYSGFEQNKKTGFALNVLEWKNTSFKKQHFLVDENMARYYYFMQDRYFYKFADSIFLFRDPFDTVYTIQNNKIIPSRVINFGKYSLPRKFIYTKHDNIFTFEDKADKHSYVHHVNHFLENTSLVYFTFRFRGQKYQVFHDKLISKTHVAHSILHDLELNNLKVETNYREVPRAINDKAIFYVIEPDYFIDQIKKIKEDLQPKEWAAYLNQEKGIKDLYNKLALEDNPVIAVYYLNE